VFWVPALVALAYAPDVLAQAGTALGAAEATTATHSLALAVLLAPLAAWALGHALRISRTLAVAVTLASLALHDLLDLLQTPQRQPFWPFSRWHLGDGAAVLPASGVREALLFAGAFAICLVVRLLTRTPGRRTPARQRLLSASLVAIVVASAGVTHYLRLVRERQLEQARSLVTEGRFAEALTAAEGADRWPSTAHPGRVDQVRAEALEELGELEAAIASYSRAVDADPAYFWAVADLAAACARSRRGEWLARAYSLRARLLRDFPRHPALQSALARVDERLAERVP
jgi:membrane-bound metal-dependent hydrolase YbcI (DUF457 family)